jgi:predicted dehydrogenase
MGNTWLNAVLNSREVDHAGFVEVNDSIAETQAARYGLDMAIHDLDMMCFFLGSAPASVFGRSWNPPWSWYIGNASAALILNFGSGIPVSYNGSWCATGIETAWSGHWRFECENGVILMRDDQVDVQPRLDDRQDVGGFLQYENGELTLAPSIQLAYADESYVLHEFYEAVTTGHMPATMCQSNIQSLAIVFGALRSFETGGIVSINEMLGGRV